MFAVIRLKKMQAVFYGLLIFAVLTAIIIGKIGNESEAAAVFKAEDSAAVLIIDAGHGGLDGGAVSVNGTAESALNLDVALRLQTAAKLFGISPEMTRTREELDYPESLGTIREKKVWDQKHRVEQINALDNAVLISIHQNTYPDPRPFGPQVLYGRAEGSDRLGELAQESLAACLCPDSRRVAAPVSDKIYLMKNITCPAILAECGFLSNPSEAQKLESDVYRTQLAVILLSSYLQFIHQ